MGNKKPLISILIPTYNRPAYLLECISSVLSQTGFLHHELECIVADNSSDERTQVMLEKIKHENTDKNILYHKNEKNLGMVGNWNKLLELKQGKFFIFLSDDDKFYDENSLKFLFDSLMKYHLDASYGLRGYIDAHGHNIHIGDSLPENNSLCTKIFTDEILGHTIGFGGILYRDFGYVFDQNVPVIMDWDFNLQYLFNQKKIGLVNHKTFLYRIHNLQECGNKRSLRRHIDRQIYMAKKYKISHPYLFCFKKICSKIPMIGKYF